MRKDKARKAKDNGKPIYIAPDAHDWDNDIAPDVHWCKKCGMVYKAIENQRNHWWFPFSWKGSIVRCAGGEVLCPPCPGPQKANAKLLQI